MPKDNFFTKVLIIGFFLFFTVLVWIIFEFIKDKKKPVDTEDLLAKKYKVFVPKTDRFKISDSYKNIKIKPYGCFINLKNQYFLQNLNPYNKLNVLDSGIIIKDVHAGNEKILKLINQLIKNGYSNFGNVILEKYEKNGPRSLSLLDYATIGYLNGYKYLSQYKADLHGKDTIYYTYSPPTVSSTIYKYGYDFSDEDFNSILTSPDLPDHELTPELNSTGPVCGFPCFENGKLDTFVDPQGITRQYMCGSVNYPNIKDPETYAVYEIYS